MVAVLLHYFSIVPFMWMLVKGAFLYFTSVKVIEFKVKSYLVTATAISYGVPLLYMVIFTLPLGFGYLDNNNYGYQQAYVMYNAKIHAFYMS